MTPATARRSARILALLAAVCWWGCPEEGGIPAADAQHRARPAKTPTTRAAPTTRPKPTTRPAPATKPAPTTKPKSSYFIDSGKFFAVAVLQNGKPVAISVKTRTAVLRRAPFAIVFKFKGTGPADVAVNVSLGPESHKAVLAGKDINKVPGMEGTGMAEGVRNSDREFFVRPDCFHFWYYDDPSDNRFDKIAPGSDHVVCTRTIEQCKVWDANDNAGPEIPISKIKGKAIHMVFAKMKKGAYSPKVGLQLDCLKLQWR